MTPNFCIFSVLTAIHLCAKFEVSRFNRPRDFRWSQNSKNGLRDPRMTHFDQILQILDISYRFNQHVQILVLR